MSAYSPPASPSRVQATGLSKMKVRLTGVEDQEVFAVKALGQHTLDDLAEARDAAGVLHQHQLAHPVAEADHRLLEADDARHRGGVGHAAVEQLALERRPSYVTRVWMLSILPSCCMPCST